MSVRVFVSPELPEHWRRIDAFAGEDYQRALVPVEGLPDGARICNVYLVERADGGESVGAASRIGR